MLVTIGAMLATISSAPSALVSSAARSSARSAVSESS